MNMQPDITGLLPEGKTMTSSVTPFDFEGHEVRVIDRNGVPWRCCAPAPRCTNCRC
jgi:hypothetical protein